MANTNRKFGIEIEFVGAERRAVERALFNAGIDARVEGYNHSTRRYWKIVTDASLHHHSGLTGELVSPILQGAEGFAELKRVCDALSQVAGLTVNRSCGLHVHLDCNDMTVAEISKVFERYAQYEEQIDLIMPRSRRGEARWCRSIKNHKDVMKGRQSKESQAYALNRYYKVNLTNIATRGAMEFRQHSGTTEYTKIANWVLFLMGFVNTSIELAGSVTTTQRRTGKRWFNQVRNFFEANGLDCTYSRGRQAWAIRKAGSNRLIGYLTHDELVSLYADQRDSVMCSNKEGSDALNMDALHRIVDTFGAWFTGDYQHVFTNQPSEAVTEAVDTGWLAGIAQGVTEYLEMRQEELN